MCGWCWLAGEGVAVAELLKRENRARETQEEGIRVIRQDADGHGWE
jgi:hypothetical protein